MHVNTELTVSSRGRPHMSVDGSVNNIVNTNVVTTVPFWPPAPVLSHCYHGGARVGSLGAVVATLNDVLTVC